MPEIEVPTEFLHEQLHHEAHTKGGWQTIVALTAALLAVLAAITSLLAGDYANEAMIDQIKASNQWAYYQAKSIKSTVVESRIELMQEMGKQPYAKDIEKVEKYKAEQKEIFEQATETEAASAKYLAMHNRLARAVTAFQIAIAICAISALVMRKWLWYSSIGLGIAGVILFVVSFI
ncbi:MAG TPA: hypothetical protein DCQ31_15330 [Bacteroidales bacterium]|nr:hypothetical protein [Bacteroidales bacterium]